MIQSESSIQQEIVQFLRFKNILVFSVPNGIFFNAYGTKKYSYMNKLKSEGFLNGVSDLVVIIENKAYFIEVKTKKGRQSENQRIFQKEVEKLGFEYHIWRSLEDAKNFLKEVKK